MPTQAEQVTLAHRRAQEQVSAVTVAIMLRLWPMLNPDDQGSVDRWLSLVLAAIRRERAESANLAAGWLTAYRHIEIPDAESFQVRPMVEINEEKVVASMMTMGPQALRKELEARQAGEAVRARREGREQRVVGITAQRRRVLGKAQAAAAVRHVHDGARDTASDVVTRDKRVIGYMRVTDGDPCWFCAMLASRGPVYREDSFNASDIRFHGPGNAKAHDGCGCDLKPMYRRGEDSGADWRKYEEIWKAAGTDQDGNVLRGWDVAKRFRQIYAA